MFAKCYAVDVNNAKHVFFLTEIWREKTSFWKRGKAEALGPGGQQKSGNFGPKLSTIGSVQFQQEKFGKKQSTFRGGPLFSVGRPGWIEY